MISSVYVFPEAVQRLGSHLIPNGRREGSDPSNQVQHWCPKSPPAYSVNGVQPSAKSERQMKCVRHLNSTRGDRTHSQQLIALRPLHFLSVTLVIAGDLHKEYGVWNM